MNEQLLNQINERLNSMQTIVDDIKAMQECVSKLWNAHSDLSTYVRSQKRTLIDLANEHPGLIIQVSLNDLVEANQLLVDNTRKDLEQLITDFHKKAPRKREDGKDLNYLTIDEATEFLPNHPTKSTLRTMCCRRQIPFCKMGGRLIFKRNELQKFIERNLNYGK